MMMFSSTMLFFLWLALSASLVTSACVNVSTFDELKNAVTIAGATLILCPFDIAKPVTSNLVFANKVIRLSCERATNTDKCVLRGQGNIIRIQQPESEVMFDGFTFQGATQAAVRIAPTSPKTQTFHDCDFLQNKGSIDGGWRGGAIKTEPGTSLVISSCSFISNAGAQGGAIFHRGDFMSVIDSSFKDNLARQGGAIKGDVLSFFEVHDTTFTDNRATQSLGGAIAVVDSAAITASTRLSGMNNMPCNGIHDETTNTCDLFESRDDNNDDQSFVPGLLSVMAAGLKLSKGLTVKIIARSGQKVAFTSPSMAQDESTIPFHAEPDGAAAFALDGGGWVYVSNSEIASRGGGVFALEFDPQGRPRNYAARLQNTSRNCAGGVTPWDTWVSCEEYGRGQCWQVDPTGKRAPEKTALVEEAGGNFESMTVDDRNLNKMQFFVTEDHPEGAVRRFRPCDGTQVNWDMIHKSGTIDYLEFLSGGRFQWTRSFDAGRRSASTHYPNVEGISHDNGIVSFVSKVKKQIYRLDLDNGTYTVSSTYRDHLDGGGSFTAQPDQLIQHKDALYFTEDGGRTPGVFVYDGSRYYALFEAYEAKYRGDETTGLAFSPDGTKLYVCLQEIGFLFQFERVDGLPFEGERRLVGMKYHLDRSLLERY